MAVRAPHAFELSTKVVAIAIVLTNRKARHAKVPRSGLVQCRLSTMRNSRQSFRAHPAIQTPHSFAETVEKDRGRLEVRRCYVFDQLQCLDRPQQWKGLRCFCVLESERTIGDKTTREQRQYISSLAPDAQRIIHTVRSHWSIENRSSMTTKCVLKLRPPLITSRFSNTLPSISSDSTQ